jgi:hypothetical protein
MMHDTMGSGMGSIIAGARLLTIALLLLAIAALIKYVFFR